MQPKLLFLKYFELGTGTEAVPKVHILLHAKVPATSTFGAGRKVAKQPQGIVLLQNHTGFKVPKDKIKAHKAYESGSN